MLDAAAVVTGAASGIGAATTSRLVAAGHRVYAIDRDWHALPDSAVEMVEGDVTDPRLVGELAERVGASPEPLRVLVNAAGAPGRAPLVDFQDDEFHRLVQTNLYSVALTMRTLLPVMIHAGGGAVVNVASMAARRADKTLAVYSATKAGVVALSRVAALEHARDGVRVNCVLPGPIDTPMLRASARRLVGSGYDDVDAVLAGYARSVPSRRLGRPDEVAAVVAFLASDEAGYVTGEEIGVGGGIHLT